MILNRKPFKLGCFIESCKELIFPAYCLECGLRLPCWELPIFCTDCLSELSHIHSPLCLLCGLPFESGEDHLCGTCLTRPYAFDKARAAFFYKKPIISVISSIKFNGQLAGVSSLAGLAKNTTAFQNLSKPDLILPVPLHRKRLKARGFNQAAIFSRACFPELHSRLNNSLIIRNRETLPQTNLTGKERRKNLSGAFTVSNPDAVKKKNILLVDDVFTTGSTVNECAKVLRKAEAKRIEVFTLARAI